MQVSSANKSANGRSWLCHRRAAVPALALTLIGCTIVAPIQEPKHDLRFPLAIKDEEPIPCVNRTDSTPTECSAKVAADLDTFHGDLGRALWETDLRRRELIGQGTERAKLNNLYNALLWPFGAIFITKKIHHPDWSTLDTAAVATASYGLLNSGIPDRDKLYVRTADRMFCAMIAAEPDLYFKRQVGLPGEAYPMASLYGRINAVNTRIGSFDTERRRLLRTLKGEPPKAAPTPSRNSILDIRSKAIALNDGAGAKSGGESFQQLLLTFTDEANRALTDARARRDEALETAEHIDVAGHRLREQRSGINAALRRALIAGSADPVSPQERARVLFSALETHLTATKAANERIASLTRQSGKGQAANWEITAERLKLLDKTSALALEDFTVQQWEPLLQDLEELAAWMRKHKNRVRLASVQATSMGCGDATLDDFSKELLRRVSDAIAVQTPASGANK